MLDLVRQTSALEISKFNDANEFDVTVVPGVLWDDLNSFNEEMMDGALKLEKVENKHIKIVQPASEDAEELVVKVKFFKLQEDDSGNPTRMRVRFVRKRGDIM